MQPDETRAEIARRRLAQLVETFDARLPPDDRSEDTATTAPSPAAPTPERAGRRVADLVPRRIGPVHVRVVAAVVAVVALLVGWQVVSGRPSAGPAAGSPGLSIEADAASDSSDAAGEEAESGTEEELVIDVVGHVHRPGIVILPPGSRVHEAITAAGGLTGPVDTTALNMARKLADGEQILVGIAPVVPSGESVSSDGPGGPAGTLVNLNTATEAELDDLPGVGPVTAAAILAWREDNGRFTSVDDLLEVRGIGEATLADLRDHVTV